MTRDYNKWLVIGGVLSLVASLLHIACIFGGGDWYRFFGAGEEMAQADEAGHWMPAIMTTGIAILLAVWAAYAFAGAGMFRRLPLIRTALVIISAIYLLRGLFIIPIMIEPALRTPFNIWSSLIVLGYGIVYLLGTRQAWSQLSANQSAQKERAI